MENWDEIKLQEVVEQKHGESNKDIPKTTIVSSFCFTIYLLHH